MTPALLLAAMLTTPAQADTVSIEVHKGGGKPLLAHDFVDAEDGATHVQAKGKWSWTATLQRMDYDGETRVCVDVIKLHPKKGSVEIGRPCIIVPTDDTPDAQVSQEADKLALSLSWTR